MAETVTARTGTTNPGLLASLDPLLRDWLPRQRWFAGKGRPVTGFSLIAVTELLPVTNSLGLYHLLVRAHQEAMPGELPGGHHGGLLGAQQGNPSGALHGSLCGAYPGEGGGLAAPTSIPGMQPATTPGDCYQLLIGVRQALPPRLAPALIGHVTDGPLTGRTVYDALYDTRPTELLLEALRTRARIGALRCEREPGREIRTGLVPRLVTAEQSNSSVVYGDTFILKLLRRVVPGINPDLELPLALAHAGCSRVPPPTAWIQTELGGEASVLGVLQPYIQGATDGWELALRELAKGEDFTGDARALGRATAEVHTALARALPTATLGHGHIPPLVDGMIERLDAAAQAVPALQPYASDLRTAYTALADLAAEGQTWTAQRVHGDLHLGQCLRAPSGEWTLIDFEGEPARPLAERRMPQPIERDVAGMLRSFDYAAHSVDTAVPGWADACRAAYCSGYAEVAGVDPRTDPVLLRAFETDKAVYEVVYEARHRPDWLPVPLSAIRRLISSDVS